MTTVREIYTLAKAMMFEKQNSTDYDGYYMHYTNVLLAELFSLNNCIRQNKGLEPFAEIPSVANDYDTVPYEVEITRDVMPKGMAMYFFIDDDLSKFNIFNTEYLNAQMKYSRVVETSIVDVYGGDC